MKRIITITLFIISLTSFNSFASVDLKKAGCSLSKDSVVTNTFSISNLGCSGDAANMQKALYEKAGVKQCVVSAQKGTVFVKYDAKKISKEELQKLIEDCSLCHDKNTKPFKVTNIK